MLSVKEETLEHEPWCSSVQWTFQTTGAPVTGSEVRTRMMISDWGLSQHPSCWASSFSQVTPPTECDASPYQTFHNRRTGLWRETKIHREPSDRPTEGPPAGGGSYASSAELSGEDKTSDGRPVISGWTPPPTSPNHPHFTYRGPEYWGGAVRSVEAGTELRQFSWSASKRCRVYSVNWLFIIYRINQSNRNVFKFHSSNMFLPFSFSFALRRLEFKRRRWQWESL